MGNEPFDLKAVALTFQRHHAFWRQSPGIVNEQLQRGEGAVAQQYAGRVPFELLQNALDRCRRHVWIRVGEVADAGAALLVGNDGNLLSVHPEFEHSATLDENRKNGRHSDFHALCSIHTSNKDPNEDYGNKGVGFRSVFSLAKWVRVWSRLDDGRWWGLEMHATMTRDTWQRRLAEHDAVRRGHELMLNRLEIPLEEGQERPSFYFPLPLLADGPPLALPDHAVDLCTLVVVPLDRPQATESVEHALGELTRAHLEFTGLREARRGVTVTVTGSDGDATRHTWMEEQQPQPTMASWTTTDRELLALAEQSRLDVKQVSVAVRWPAYAPPADEEGERPRSLIYCYLPSQVDSACDVDVHADFQLGIDRKHIELEETEPIGEYNSRLLTIAAELHFLLLLRAFGIPEDAYDEWVEWEHIDPASVSVAGEPAEGREDLWRFVNPEGQGTPKQKQLLAEHLFGCHAPKSADDWQWWAQLARGFFSVPRTREAHAGFWDATEAWVHVARKRRDTREATARAAHQALVAAEARVVPVVAGPGPLCDLVPVAVVPTAAGAGRGKKRVNRRIFQIRDSEETPRIEVPEALRDRGRVATAWRFPQAFAPSGQLIGTLLFERGALLRELRQLPNNLTGWKPSPLDENPEEAIRRQRMLLDFAAELFMLPVRSGQSVKSYQDALVRAPGWRLGYSESASEEQEAGQALATTFLPTREALWEPARQLDVDALDPEWTAALTKKYPALDLRAFLSFLGVSPQPGGLLLVEGGEDGLVEARQLPPALEAATPGVAIPPLMMPMRGPKAPRRPLIEVVREAWQLGRGWLATVLAREDEYPKRFAIRGQLSDSAWYPVVWDDVDLLLAPAGISHTPEAMAPRELTLQPPHANRLARVLWRVPLRSPDRELLTRLGAAREVGEWLGSSERALRLYALLQELDLDEVSRDPTDRLGLLDLHQQVVETLADDDHGEALPLLCFEPSDAKPEAAPPLSSRQLAWRPFDQPAWLAANNTDRETVRHFFPALPLCAATLGPKKAGSSWFETRLLEVDERVDHHGAVIGSECAAEVRRQLWLLLPSLLALAEVSRQLNRPIDTKEVLARWSRTTIEHVADAWKTFVIRGPVPPPPAYEWRKGKYHDVFHRAAGKTDDATFRAQIVFDSDAPDASPPLRFFGHALAAVLVDPILEGLWRSALAEHGAGTDDAGRNARLAEFVERMGAVGLVDDFRRRLSPLDEKQTNGYRSKLNAALTGLKTSLVDPGAELSALLQLSLADLEVPDNGWGDLEEHHVQAALDAAGWDDAEAPFRPTFSCQSAHRASWEQWCNSSGRRVRLLRLATSLATDLVDVLRDEALESSAAGHRLRSLAAQRATRLAFSPEDVAREWLFGVVEDAAARFGARAIEELLPPLRSFQAVTAAPSLAVWLPFEVPPKQATERELKPRTSAQYADEHVAKAGKGVGAEMAFVPWVAEQTRRLIDDDPERAWKELVTAIPPNGVVAERLAEARAGTRDLADALHVAKVWGSAGFDVLGLACNEAGPYPARFEVKAIPSEGKLVRVFVSLNEVAVYRRCSVNGADARYRGSWSLVGVSEEGTAHDLTSALEPVRDADAPSLRGLAEQGIEPEGLRITLVRPP